MLPNIPLGILETVFLWIIKVLFECDNLNPTYASFLQILVITYNFFTISTVVLFVPALLWPILVCIHVCGNIPVCKCSMKRFIVSSNNQTSSSSGESCGSVAVGYKYQYLDFLVIFILMFKVFWLNMLKLILVELISEHFCEL